MSKYNLIKLPKDVKKRWLKALRSGKYKKTKGRLRFIDGNNDASYCCLGVLCDVENVLPESSWQWNDFYPPQTESAFWTVLQQEIETKKLTFPVRSFLANKNDGVDIKPWSFNKIANWIDKHL